MIAKKWMNVLAIAGATAAVAAVIPSISQAHMHYTGKTPAGIALMAESSAQPRVKKVSTVTRKHKKLKHKTVSTASVKHRHHKLKHKTGLKKKTV